MCSCIIISLLFSFEPNALGFFSRLNIRIQKTAMGLTFNFLGGYGLEDTKGLALVAILLQ